MKWPQVVMVGLLSMDMAIYLLKHGEQKQGKYNFWIACIANGMLVWLLIKGGFFHG